MSELKDERAEPDVIIELSKELLQRFSEGLIMEVYDYYRDWDHTAEVLRTGYVGAYSSIETFLDEIVQEAECPDFIIPNIDYDKLEEALFNNDFIYYYVDDEYHIFYRD